VTIRTRRKGNTLNNTALKYFRVTCRRFQLETWGTGLGAKTGKGTRRALNSRLKECAGDAREKVQGPPIFCVYIRLLDNGAEKQ
jgi:hypothetical protein